MGQNEVYYAGARAAAEAGLNRSIVKITANTTTNWLAGNDGAFDAVNLGAPENLDNGSLSFLLGAGPHYVDAANQYWFEVQILDDDNPLAYTTPPTQNQRIAMGEATVANPDANPYVDVNRLLILRAIGYGPQGTVVRISRMIESNLTTETNNVNVPSLANPALLVNGDLTINGSVNIVGDSANVHANSDLTISGGGGLTVEGSATSTEGFTVNGSFTAAGAMGGGRPTITVPDIQAETYIDLANYKLASNGQIQVLSGGSWVHCTTTQCANSNWTFAAGSGGSMGTWTLNSKTTTSATYYVEGHVNISGSPKGDGSEPNIALSLIALGNIDISGSPKFRPATDTGIQFITNGDFRLRGGGDFDADNPNDIAQVDGQIFVREQIDIAGSSVFGGRILVQDVASVQTLATSNVVAGSFELEYDGLLSQLETYTPTTITTSSYVNNISGWMEQ